jgi:uncharacterized membrane protein
MANSIQMEHRAGHPLLVSAGAANNYVKFRSAQSILVFLTSHSLVFIVKNFLSQERSESDVIGVSFLKP